MKNSKIISLCMAMFIIMTLLIAPFTVYAYDNELPLIENHTLVKVEAKAATTTTPGNIEYWYCTDCGSFFSDENGYHKITEKDTIIPVIQTETKTTTVVKPNPLKLSTSKKTYKAKTLKKSKKSFTVKVTKFKGKVTYSLNDAAKAAKIKMKKTGSSSKAVKYKIIVPKKCKKGIYEVNINAAGGSGYDAGTKTIVIKVK